jgi:3-oxoacyl-[acyl-carrier-protein] synthase-3
LPASFETVRNRQHYIHMNGREVYRFATRVMVQATKEAVAKAGLTMDDIHLVVPHQANQRIIEAALHGLEIPMERCITNVEHYGNTSTASIPMATCEAVDQGRLKGGDWVALVGFGAGLTWGAAVVKWTGPLLPQRQVYPATYRLWVRLRSRLRRWLRYIEGLIWGRKYPEI